MKNQKNIYVTHDQVEAMTMGTKIVVMKDGLIQQVGAPLDVFNFPVNQFVAGFIGSPVMNFVPCRITARDGKLFIDTEAFQIAIPEKRKPYYEGLAGKEAVFGIRLNDIYDLAHSPDRIKGNVIKAKVDVVEPLGTETHLYLNAGNHDLIAAVDAQSAVRVHQEIELAVDLDKMHLFEKDAQNLRVKTDV